MWIIKSEQGETEALAEQQGLHFAEETAMKEFDFGYFGTGDEGYAQYRTAFDRIFGTDPDSADLDTDHALEEDDFDETNF